MATGDLWVAGLLWRRASAAIESVQMTVGRSASRHVRSQGEELGAGAGADTACRDLSGVSAGPMTRAPPPTEWTPSEAEPSDKIQDASVGRVSSSSSAALLLMTVHGAIGVSFSRKVMPAQSRHGGSIRWSRSSRRSRHPDVVDRRLGCEASARTLSRSRLLILLEASPFSRVDHCRTMG